MLIKVDMTPYIAAAIARNGLCARKLRALYRINRAACHVAARNSAYFKHPAISTGRAEFEINARRALGVLLTSTSASDVLPIIRTGWRKLASAIESIPMRVAVSFADVVPHNQKEYTENAYFDILVIACMVTSLSGRSLADDSVTSRAIGMFEEHTRILEHRHEQQLKPELFDAEVYARAQMLFRGAALPGMTGLTDAFGDQRFFHIEAMLDALGFSIHDYCDGIELHKTERAICAHFASGRVESIPELALLCMLTRAIQRDRAFCLESFRDDKSEQIEAANAAASAAKETFRDAEKQIASLRAECLRQEAELKRVTEELAKHEGDSRELVALRDALYAAQPLDVDVVHENKAQRSLPEGIVSLGGRPAWLNHMRERFPTVKFISPDSTFNDAELRSASEIWFNPLYISHTQYYRAIGIARAHNVQVRYFSSSGADRSEIELLS